MNMQRQGSVLMLLDDAAVAAALLDASCALARLMQRELQLVFVESSAALAAASLPVAGNSYILAHHFGVAVHRVSAAILISTAASIATVPVVIHWITKG